MYGLLLESIAEFAKRLYGNAVWDKVRKKAKIENVSFSSHHQYSETLFQKIMKILADVTGNLIVIQISDISLDSSLSH